MISRMCFLLTCLSGLVFPRGTDAQSADERPNFVVIFTDDQGYQDVGCFGSPDIQTPHLDQMAREGMRFTDFLVAQSVCSASRAALLTGCYSNRVGIRGALSGSRTDGINPEESTIAEVLKTSDYATAIYGKWHLGHHHEFLPLQHGFDDYFGLPYSNDMWPLHPTAGAHYSALPLIDGNKAVEYNPDQRQLTTQYTRRAVSFIEHHKDKPFFLYLAHSMPHVPLFVSDKYQGKSPRGLYGDVISEIDWSVGQVLETLKRLGLDEKTLVVFTSDNGPWLSYGNHSGSALPLREGKGTTWEGGMREPCIMRWPGKIPAGTECRELAATIDILPTLAKIAEADLPQDRIIDGKDIRPLMFGEPGAKTPHDVYYYYWVNELHALRSGKWKLHFKHPYRSLKSLPGNGGRPGPYIQKETGIELYDLDADVSETNNVASYHPAVVERLMGLAEEAREDLGDSLTGRKGKNNRPPGQLSPAELAERNIYPVEENFNDQEFAHRPTPGWVKMIDQGQNDPRLTGLKTPAGIKVEIVAEEPAVIDPVALNFDSAGRPYVIEWREADERKHGVYTVKYQDGSEATVNRMYKPVGDEFKQLVDTDHDGIYDKSQLLMDDLEMPSMALMHDGWTYLPSVGHVIRRRQSKVGGSYDVEEEIVRGLCGFHHHQNSGLALSHDGWMYATAGDDDNRGEGSDGSRATVLRTGAVLRMRPDGSELAEYARGFRNPYRNVVFDDMFNMFHVDNDQEDGSKFQGVRLIHIVEGADYGWRLLPGALCCRTDFARGAVFGEKPGKLPSMLKTGRGAPAGLLIYQGNRFPGFFRGLLIYADVYRKMVRAYKVEPAGSTFRVTEQFELMTSEDGLFRPCQTVIGPDGAIYIVDWRTDSGGAGKLWGDSEHGRIYRLSWSGTDDHPAIPLGPMNAWQQLASASDEDLWDMLAVDDFELRMRVIDQLVKRNPANRNRFVNYLLDSANPVIGRVAAIGGASRLFDEAVLKAMVQNLTDPNHDLRRLSADAINRHVIVTDINGDMLAALAAGLRDPHPAVKRCMAIALGQLASLLPQDDQRRIDATTELVHALSMSDGLDRYLHDGLVRAVERTGKTGVDQLVTFAHSPVPGDIEFALWALESSRTHEAADGLDQILKSDTSAFSEGQLTRLLVAYRYIQVEPAISLQEVVQWLQNNPDAPAGMQIAALESIGLSGRADADTLTSVARRLMSIDDPQTRIAAANAIGESRITSAAPILMAALKNSQNSLKERQSFLEALGKLRSLVLPWTNEMTPRGVENVIDDLLLIVDDKQQGPIRADALSLAAQVDFEKAEPVAQRLLASNESWAVTAAIETLGLKPEHARAIAEKFLANEIDRTLLPQVADALQRHVAADTSQTFESLLTEVYKGGLLLTLKNTDVAEVEEMVKRSGDPERGLKIYVDTKKTQCINCHQMEGAGRKVGPDLTGVWQTQTVAKLIESILEPSKEIKEGFATWTVITDGGQVYNGLQISKSEQEIVLRDAAGKDVRIPVNEIDESIANKKSLMPEGVITQLKLEEFIDLIAFLKSQQAQKKLPTHASANGSER